MLTQEVQDTTRVTPLVIVPCNELNEVFIESDTGFGVENAGVVVSVQVGRHKVVLGVGHDA